MQFCNAPFNFPFTGVSSQNSFRGINKINCAAQISSMIHIQCRIRYSTIIMNIIKSVKSNSRFITTLVIFSLIAFNPDAEAFLINGVKNTELFTPDVSDRQTNSTHQKTEPKPLVESAKFISSKGIAIDLANLKGKVIFLNFWTTWCLPCIVEMRSVNSLYNKFKDNSNVVFVMADADGDFKTSTAFMKKKKFVLPVYIPTGKMPAQLFRGSLPTTVIISKKGEIVYFHEGMANYNSPKMEKFLNELAK